MFDFVRLGQWFIATLLLISCGCASWPASDAYRLRQREKMDEEARSVYEQGLRYRINFKADQNASESKQPRETDFSLSPQGGGKLDALDMPYLARGENDLNSDSNSTGAIPVNIQFNDVELKIFLDTVIKEVMGGSYVMAAQPRQKVSVEMNGKFSPQSMLSALRLVLESMNLSLNNAGGVYFITPINAPGANRNHDMQLMIYSPHHIRAENLIALLKDLKSVGGKLMTIQGTNIIFMLDYPDVQSRAKTLMDVFDVAFFQDKFVRIYSLHQAIAADVQKELEQLVKQHDIFTDGKGKASLQLVALNRQNKLVAIAADRQSLQYTDRWVLMLDQVDMIQAGRSLFVYHPSYLLAEDLKSSLSNLFKALKEDSLTGLDAYADSKNNVLFVKCRPDLYLHVRSLLQELDKQPPQIYIQAVLAEVRITEDMKLGFDWWFRRQLSGTLDGTLEVGSQVGDQTGTGLVVGFTVDNFLGILSAMVSDGTARLISTPHILVKNGKEASVEVITSVPFVKSFETTDSTISGSTATKPSIDQKDVGVKLNVTPRLVGSSEVELSIEQELSEKGNDVQITSTISSPEFNARKIKTELVIKSSETVLIGGLIEENKTGTKAKLPGLGDVPLLKYFFKSDKRDWERTELVLFLTPVVVNNTNSLQNLSNKLSELYALTEVPEQE